MSNRVADLEGQNGVRSHKVVHINITVNLRQNSNFKLKMHHKPLMGRGLHYSQHCPDWNWGGAPEEDGEMR